MSLNDIKLITQCLYHIACTCITYTVGAIFTQRFSKENYIQNWNSKKQDIRKEKPSNRQYDWTYQTSYKGSIRGEKSVKADPGALCDLENLKKRETIGWYRDIRLYDDELDDNGAVSLGVKIRVMPSCFFILVRYYLRVDKGML